MVSVTFKRPPVIWNCSFEMMLFTVTVPELIVMIASVGTSISTSSVAVGTRG